MSNNERLKEIMYQRRVPQWKLADKLGVGEMTVYRKLRSPMKDDLYETYLKAVEDIIKENESERMDKNS